MEEEDWDEDVDFDEDDDDDGWGDDADLDDDDDYGMPMPVPSRPEPVKQPEVQMSGGKSLYEVMLETEKTKAAGHDKDNFLHTEDTFKTFREQQKTIKYAGFFKNVYQISQKFQRNWEIPLTKAQQLEQITEVVNSLTEEIPKNEPKKEKIIEKKECEVCASTFGSDVQKITFSNCKHSNVCNECFQRWISTKVKDSDVMPWIRCPAAECFVYVTPKEILESGIQISEMYRFAEVYLGKHLMRQQDWVECVSDDCDFGFIVGKGAAAEEKSCLVCRKLQEVKPKEIKIDDEFKKMLDEGKVRPCPACQHPAIKEKGLCNVLQCANCAIWWNWRTRETGTNSRQLKAKAKASGVLWEPGELEYQQKLQRDDLPAFIALLERNGIKYDPNYRRGGW